METISAVLGLALLLSAALNVFQRYHFKKAESAAHATLDAAKQAALDAAKKPVLETTAQDLLHDFTRRGHAVLRIEVLDTENLYLRSPRG